MFLIISTEQTLEIPILDLEELDLIIVQILKTLHSYILIMKIDLVMIKQVGINNLMILWDHTKDSFI